jgi:hypothetical protein
MVAFSALFALGSAALTLAVPFPDLNLYSKISTPKLTERAVQPGTGTNNGFFCTYSPQLPS